MSYSTRACICAMIHTWHEHERQTSHLTPVLARPDSKGTVHGSSDRSCHQPVRRGHIPGDRRQQNEPLAHNRDPLRRRANAVPLQVLRRTLQDLDCKRDRRHQPPQGRPQELGTEPGSGQHHPPDGHPRLPWSDDHPHMRSERRQGGSRSPDRPCLLIRRREVRGPHQPHAQPRARQQERLLPDVRCGRRVQCPIRCTNRRRPFRHTAGEPQGDEAGCLPALHNSFVLGMGRR